MEYGQPLFVCLSRDRPSIRTYVHTYESADCTGGLGETLKRKGGCLRRVLANLSTSFVLATRPLKDYPRNNLIKKTLSLRSVNHERLSFYGYTFISKANSKFFRQKFTWSRDACADSDS